MSKPKSALNMSRDEYAVARSAAIRGAKKPPLPKKVAADKTDAELRESGHLSTKLATQMTPSEYATAKAAVIRRGRH